MRAIFLFTSSVKLLEHSVYYCILEYLLKNINYLDNNFVHKVKFWRYSKAGAINLVLMCIFVCRLFLDELSDLNNSNDVLKEIARFE